MSGGKTTVQQTRSPIRRHSSQRATLIGLGLNKIGRTRTLPDTAATRGMIAKVRHLIRVIEPAPGEPKRLSPGRFDALAAYTRDPQTILIFEEIEWHATRDERVIAVLVHDRIDQRLWVRHSRTRRAPALSGDRSGFSAGHPTTLVR